MRKGFRFISVLTASILLLGMTACGGSDTATNDTDDSQEVTTESTADAGTSGDSEETEEQESEEAAEDTGDVPEGMKKVAITDDVYGIDVEVLLPDYGWTSDGESDMSEVRAFVDAILSATKFTEKDSRTLPTVTIE